MSFTPSMSRLGLARACLFPWTGGVRWPRSEVGEAARYGSAVSRVAERLARGEAPDAEAAAVEFDVAAELPRLLRDADAIAEFLADESRYWHKAETPLALHPVRGTARELLSSGPRDYSDVRPGELTGTPDLVFVRAADELVVRDYKTGQYTRRLRPRDSAQLRALGLAAALAYGARQVTVELVQVDDGVVAPRTDVLDEWDLDCVRTELIGILDALERPSVPRPGRHCTDSYCPLVAVCPATRAALAAVDQAAALEHPFSPTITSPDHAASVRVRLKMVEAATREIRAALEAYVAEHGAVELGGGHWYGPVQCDGTERVDLGVAGAVAAIRERLGEHADEALEVKTSKAALERAARAATKDAERGAATRVREELYGELRRLGALRQGPPFTKFEEFKKETDHV